MTFPADLRHAARLLARSPAFAVTAVLSLSLGVAASSTIVSVADALLGPATGVREAGRVVDVGRGNAGRGFDNMSHPAFEYLRAHATSFEGLAGVEFGGRPMSLMTAGSSERVFGNLVSANFFDVLGTRPALGRFFRSDEDVVPGERPVVVLTHRFWTRRLGADPAVLDRPLVLNNRQFAVVGVAEPGFEGVNLAGTDLWLPMAMVAEARGRASAAELTDVRGVMHMGVGRLKPGVGRGQAESELNALMAQFKAANPTANQRHTASVLPTSRVPGPMRTPFLVFVGVLLALTGALLAIACSNVAGMLLARATSRRREMATRLAIGASRGRLLAQLLTETALLFLVAGVIAVPLTIGGVRLLNAFLPSIPVALNLAVTVNGRVVAFALGVSLAAAVGFGLAPARHALGHDLAPLLHGAAATADRRRLWLRHGLVVAQVALSLMLVATAGLFVRTLQAAANIDAGFTTTDVALANLDVSLSGFRGPAAVDLVQRLQARVAALPGVTAVAAARVIPLQGSGFGSGPVAGARTPRTGRRRHRRCRLERGLAGVLRRGPNAHRRRPRPARRRPRRRHPRRRRQRDPGAHGRGRAAPPSASACSTRGVATSRRRSKSWASPPTRSTATSTTRPSRSCSCRWRSIRSVTSRCLSAMRRAPRPTPRCGLPWPRWNRACR